MCIPFLYLSIPSLFVHPIVPSFSVLRNFRQLCLLLKSVHLLVHEKFRFLHLLRVSSRHFRDNTARKGTATIRSLHQSHLRRLTSRPRPSVFDLPRRASKYLEPATNAWTRRLVTVLHAPVVFACVGLVWRLFCFLPACYFLWLFPIFTFYFCFVVNLRQVVRAVQMTPLALWSKTCYATLSSFSFKSPVRLDPVLLTRVSKVNLLLFFGSITSTVSTLILYCSFFLFFFLSFLFSFLSSFLLPIQC